MRIASGLVIFSAILMLAAAKTGPSHGKLVVCYISTWAVYRSDKGKFSLDNVNPGLCTHAIYAFSGLDVATSSIKSMDPWQDLKDDWGKGGYEKLTGFRQTYPHLKVLLAIGGWNEGSINYSKMAADAERRKRFIKSAVDFVRRYKFDGLDLDWEYPTQRGGQPQDKDNFVLLVKELKDSFRPFNLLVTSAFGASKKIIDESYDIPALSKHLDFMHIMCYDYGGAWDRQVTANAPLRGQGQLNVEYTIDYLIKLGAAPTKIVLGLPFYGRTFITKLDGEFGDPASEMGFQGVYTKENGFMGYNEICALLSDQASGWKRSYSEEMSQAVARYRDDVTNETRVAVFDSSRSIARKIQFAMSRNLAGAMIWSIDTDDFLGDCDIDTDTFADFKPIPGVTLNYPKRIETNFPLLRTINEAMVVALDEIAQEAQLPARDEDNEIPQGNHEHGGSSSDGDGSAAISYSVSKIAILPIFVISFAFQIYLSN